MRKIRNYDSPRLIKHTEQGERLNQQIQALEGLVKAYEDGLINEEQL